MRLSPGLFIILALVGLIVVLACNGESTPAATTSATGTLIQAPTSESQINIPTFEAARCQFQEPFGYSAECGYLTVPENRNKSNSPTIRLHVTIFRSQSPNPAPDPVVYLEGGPGGHALEILSLIFDRRYARFLEDRDFIIFDQRGTGFSEPSLDCPEYISLVSDTLNQDLSAEQGLELELDTVRTCCERLAIEGVDFASYNSAENAADLNVLRQALGYDEWNLYGVSYGTRLGLTEMRDFPEGIRSVILDSTYPPQVNLYTALPSNIDRAYNVLFDGCAGDPECSLAYPELETVFYDTVETLDINPVLVPMNNPFTDEQVDVLIDGVGFMDMVFESLYSADVIALLPELIFDVQNSRFETFALLLESLLADIQYFSLGMHLSVQCNEEVRFGTPEEIDAAVDAHPNVRAIFENTSSEGEGLFATCDIWGAGRAASIENQPVSGEIPTLIMAGQYDPITPPVWGQLVSETLPNSFYFEFPGLGHGAISSSGCAFDIALDFLDEPTNRPDADCIASMRGPDFIAPATQISLVPFTNSEFGITGVVPEDWTEIAPGFYGRSGVGVVSILQQAAPGLGTDQLLRLLMGQLGVNATPKTTTTRNANGLTWSLYETETQGFSIDIGLAEDDIGTAYLILFSSTASKRGLYYERVYLPAIDALTPLPNE